MSQRPLRVKFRQQRSKLLIWRVLVKSNLVFRKRSNHTVARKHRRALHHRRRTDPIHANLRRQRNRKLTHQMIHRRLAHVVRLAAAFRHNCIRRTRQHNARIQILFTQQFRRFFHQPVIRRHINIQSRSPQTVADRSVRRRRENRRRIHNNIDPAKRRHCFAQ